MGINMFWALPRAHFNPRLAARAEMSLSRAQNIFMPKNINSIVLFVTSFFHARVTRFLLLLNRNFTEKLCAGLDNIT